MHYRTRRVLWTGGLLFLGLLLLIAGVSLYGQRLRQQVLSEKAETEQQIAALATVPPQSTPAMAQEPQPPQSAAPVPAPPATGVAATFERVAKEINFQRPLEVALPMVDSDDDRNWRYPDQALSPEVFSVLEGIAANNAALLDDLRSALRAETMNWPPLPDKAALYPAETRPDVLKGVLNAHYLLFFDALVRIEKRDTEGATVALESIANFLRLTDTAETPRDISHVYGNNWPFYALLMVERYVNRVQGIGVEQVDKLLRAFASLERPELYMLRLRVNLDATLDRVRNEQKMHYRARTSISDLPFKAWAALNQPRNEYQAQKFCREVASAATLPYAERHERFRRISWSDKRGRFVAGLEYFDISETRRIASYRLVMAGLTAYRLYLTNGAWPRDIAALAAAMPGLNIEDPFSETSLCLNLNKERFVVYSVDWDLKDNGGERTKTMEHRMDTVFRVSLPRN